MDGNTEVKIRKLRNSDASYITKMLRDFWTKVSPKMWKRELSADYKELYDANEDFVAVINNDIAGVIGYWRLNHEPKKIVWLDWLIVHKNYRRRGIGSILLKHLLKVLQKAKIKMLCVEHSSKDVAAEKFYRARGFKEQGRIPDYWDDGGDLVILTKKVY